MNRRDGELISVSDSGESAGYVGPPKGWLVGAMKAPFQDGNWISRYWIVPILSLIPVINLVMLRGWRLEQVANLARQRSPSLPAPELFFIFLLKGALLWLMTLVYHLPHLLFLILHGAQLLYAAEKGQEAFLHELVLVAGITIVATLITWPVYRVAMMRYAVTGSLWSFVLIPQNVLISLRFYHRFIALWFCVTLLNIVHLLIFSVLSLTLVGLLLAVLFTIPIYYAASGHLYAQLASRIALGCGWFIPVAAEAAAGPRTPKKVSVLRVLWSFIVSALLLLLALGAAAGLALWLSGPINQMDPALQQLIESSQAGNWEEAWEALRTLEKTWLQWEPWLELLPEDARAWVEGWLDMQRQTP